MEGPTGRRKDMVTPNSIPRTLRGVGGIRLYDIPGVIYPQEVLITKVGLHKKSGKPYQNASRWGIPTSKAAALLRCSESAARRWLHKNKVPFRIVSADGEPIRLYWHKKSIEKYAASRPPLKRKKHSALITAEEAQSILHVSRSTIGRYQKKGFLSAIPLRTQSATGMHTRLYCKRQEALRLARKLASFPSTRVSLRLFLLSKKSKRK